jgi:hypothetical protein
MSYVRTDPFYEWLSGKADGISVDLFLDRIATQYHNLQDKSLLSPFLKFFNEEKAGKFMRWWYKNRNLRRLYVLGLTNKDIQACTKLIGVDELYKRCLENPYELIPLPVEKCKHILLLLNQTISAEDTLTFLLLRKLQTLVDGKAWMCLPLQNLFFQWSNDPDIGLPEDIFNAQIKKMCEKKYVFIQNDFIYPRWEYEMEAYVVKRLKELTTNLPPFSLLSTSSSFFNSDLNDDQRAAVVGALNHPISIITGQAGSGKSVCISEITQQLSYFEEQYPGKFESVVASPTGKAASRVREILKGRSASTLHRLLKEKNSKKFQWLIIDESSMVTTDLMYEIFTTFPWDFHLVLIGDKNQLPPIGKGAFFEQLIKSGKIPIFTLTKNYRSFRPSGAPNGILHNANALLAENLTGFTFIPFDNFFLLPETVNSVTMTATALKRAGIGVDQLTIVAPYNADIQPLNRLMQYLFQEESEKVTDAKGVEWNVGDRVMMTNNNYVINVMNGEEGHVVEVADDHIKIAFKEGELHKFLLRAPKDADSNQGQGYQVQGYQAQSQDITGGVTGDKEIPVTAEAMAAESDELTTSLLIHSSVISIHRSQGSEWDYGIIYIPKRSSGDGFITKQLLYTAITRFKHSVWIVADKENLARIVQRISKEKYDFMWQAMQKSFDV